MTDFIETLYSNPLAIAESFSVFLTLLLALILDKYLGEAKRFHYLVGFGRLANIIELKLNHSTAIKQSKTIPIRSKTEIVLGAFSWCVLVLPIPILYILTIDTLSWYWQVVLDATLVYLALGLNSLHQHAQQIYQPLVHGNIEQARHFTGYIVSRDTRQLNEEDIARATVESVLENGHDAVIASLVYYMIGGAPLVILHRFANTLDAMWGYKNIQFKNFGYWSARADDILGFVSGKCSTLLYALQAKTWSCINKAIVNAFFQGNQYKSHNGGWVMAAGATVMNITLGGSAYYHGNQVHSVQLGQGKKITVHDISKSLKLVINACMLLLLLLFFANLAWSVFH